MLDLKNVIKKPLEKGSIEIFPGLGFAYTVYESQGKFFGEIQESAMIFPGVKTPEFAHTGQVHEYMNREFRMKLQQHQ